MDLFQLYADAGRTGLMVALAGQPVDRLKALCREYRLDCTGSYRKYQHSGELAEFMAHRVRCMSERGSVFR